MRAVAPAAHLAAAVATRHGALVASALGTAAALGPAAPARRGAPAATAATAAHATALPAALDPAVISE